MTKSVPAIPEEILLLDESQNYSDLEVDSVVCKLLLTFHCLIIYSKSWKYGKKKLENIMYLAMLDSNSTNIILYSI